MDTREALMHEAATMYYLQDATMETVARQLGMSRSGVSRLLKGARDCGMVRVQVREPGSGNLVAAALERTYGARFHVVPVRSPIAEHVRLDHVARYGAQLLEEWFRDGMTLGVAWGTTVAALRQHLRPAPLRDATVVQLNGAANTSASGLAYGTDLVSDIAEAFGANAEHFPVPAFFDYAETRELMWRERSVQHVLALQELADLAVFGVGALAGPVSSHVYSSGYLDGEDKASLQAAGVVGDVCTVFLRRDGSWEDIAINTRGTGPNPRQLRRIPRRMCLAAGAAKVGPLRAALLAGAVTDVVIDEPSARRLARS